MRARLAISIVALLSCASSALAQAPTEVPPFAQLDCAAVAAAAAAAANGPREEWRVKRLPIPPEVRLAGIVRRSKDPGELCSFRAANATLPPATPQRVVFLGDSITAGWKNGDPALFEGDVVNRGISGQTTQGMLMRFRADVVALHPAVVHIMGGTNDIQNPAGMELTKDNLQSMAEIAKANRITVVLAAIPPSADFWTTPGLEPGPRIVALNAWIKEYAARNGLIFVDYHSPFVGPSLGYKPGLSDDDMHPTKAGYGLVHDRASSAIAQALKQKR